jgi:tetratricopeptide (TPR) repeat protein
VNNARWERIQAVFHDAASHPETEWHALLASTCEDDESLKIEVFNMLQADKETGGLLGRDINDLARELVSAETDLIPLFEFGSYRLTGKKLGEGGMGSVWVAQRKDAGNLVAVKFLVHAGLSPARRESFAREIRTLAKLKHPFIARLYDAGTLEDGTPWFAMEYVVGEPFKTWCQRERMIAGQLRLFRLICEAVQYAHGQEIIHRDLKPSNILVEADGTPRLLDFGIARELRVQEDLPDRTRPGLRMMTPEYAAPEWIEDGTLGFFTDVYSLGVILYEMLTRKPRSLGPGGAGAVERPSVPGRLSFPEGGFLGNSTAWTDLDMLYLKATHRDVSQRYQSVEALLRDVNHYLRGEPLEARPDSFRYRVGKFVARNRRVVFAASVGSALLIGLLIAFAMRLAKARNAELAEAARTMRVEQFMLNLFEGGDKTVGPSNDLRVVALLDRGVKNAQELNHDPAIQAEVYETLGGIYEKLGNFPSANRLLQSAFEERRSVFGSDSTQVAESMVALGILQAGEANLADAEKNIRAALAILTRRLQPGDPALYRAQMALGKVLNERGQYKEAITILAEVVQREPIHGGETRAGTALTELADAHFYLGHYAISTGLNQRALEADERAYGSHHPRAAGDLVNLGNIQSQVGHYVEAERYYRRAMEIDQAWYGKDHPDTADATTYVAQAEMYQGRYAEASPLLEEALASMERVYGKNHPRVALVLNVLGSVHQKLGKLSQAESEEKRTVEIYRSAYGDKHWMTAVALGNLASVYLEKRQYHRAEPIFRDVIQRFTEAQSANHLNTGMARIKLGRTLLSEQRYTEAEKETLAGYEIVRRQSRASVSWLNAARRDLVKIYHALNEPDKASQFLNEVAAEKGEVVNSK